MADHEIGIDSVEGFHAHVYFRTPQERLVAMRLRLGIGRRFKRAVLGRVHDRRVGPHPIPMYQVAFGVEDFSELTCWLMLNREDLSVLIHPLTGDPLPEHRDQACWLGDRLELQLSIFEAMSEESRASA